MEFPSDPSVLPMDSEKEEDPPNRKLRTDFNKTVLKYDFMSGEARSVSDGSYISEVGLRSAAWRLEYN